MDQEEQLGATRKERWPSSPFSFVRLDLCARGTHTWRARAARFGGAPAAADTLFFGRTATLPPHANAPSAGRLPDRWHTRASKSTCPIAIALGAVTRRARVPHPALSFVQKRTLAHKLRVTTVDVGRERVRSLESD